MQNPTYGRKNKIDMENNKEISKEEHANRKNSQYLHQYSSEQSTR